MTQFQILVPSPRRCARRSFIFIAGAVVVTIGPELWRLLMPVGGRRRECA